MYIYIYIFCVVFSFIHKIFEIFLKLGIYSGSMPKTCIDENTFTFLIYNLYTDSFNIVIVNT